MIPEPLKSLRGHMRNFFVALMASLLSCSAAFAFWPEAVDSSLEIGVGYRRDDFKWETHAKTWESSSGGDVLPVNLRSELKWKNLDIWQIEAMGKYVTCDNIYLRGYADYGWITHGRNTDTDFASAGSFSGSECGCDDNANFTTSSFCEELACSKSRTKGHVYDVSFGLGYQFRMCDDTFAISPLIGYSWHGQHLELKHDNQSSEFCDACNDCNDSYSSSYYSYSDYSSSSCSRLHSKYRARWNGPWLGFDLDYKFLCDWSVFASYEYHWACYHASADWNLRTDLIDGFHHRAKRADGQVATLGVNWDMCDCWTVSLIGRWQYWRARHGRDRALIDESCNGDIDVKCFGSIPLKEVTWCSGSISVDVGMRF